MSCTIISWWQIKIDKRMALREPSYDPADLKIKQAGLKGVYGHEQVHLKVFLEGAQRALDIVNELAPRVA